MKAKHYVTCGLCGWAHSPVSREYAEESVRNFNTFYDAAPAHVRENYTQRSDISAYEHCVNCGAHFLEFTESKVGDCPDGCTLSPIIWESL